MARTNYPEKGNFTDGENRILSQPQQPILIGGLLFVKDLSDCPLVSSRACTIEENDLQHMIYIINPFVHMQRVYNMGRPIGVNRHTTHTMCIYVYVDYLIMLSVLMCIMWLW